MEPIIRGNWQGFPGMGLPPRQLEFLLYVASGFRDKEIARETGVAPSTVKKAVLHALWRLDCRHRAELVGRAIAKGIITPLLLLLMVAMTAVQATPDHQPATRNRIVRVKGGARRDADVSVFRIC